MFVKYLLPLFFIAFISCKHSIPVDVASNEIDSGEVITNYDLFEYRNDLNAELYQSILDSVKQGLSADYFSLRMAFTQSDDYHPYGIETRTLFAEISTKLDSSKFDDAIEMLLSIQEKEFTNIRSHLYAGYAYEQLGDIFKSDFHYSIYEGLLESIYHSGDGLAPETAYLVINTTEEYDFLNWFSLQLQEQSLIHHDGYSFDLMKASDSESGENFEIFFNVTIPIRTLIRN